MSGRALERSAALWNRSHLDLRSDEVLAQLLDRGELAAWRELYRLAAADAALRRRIVDLCVRVPIGFPHFWLAAMRSVGERLDRHPDVPRGEPGI